MKEDQSHAFPREGGRVELDARNNLLGEQEETGGGGGRPRDKEEKGLGRILEGRGIIDIYHVCHQW